MGFLGSLIDDAFDLPKKVLERSLSLPADVIEAARKAGCRTSDEIEEFARELERRMDP